ncbi:MAG: hypothetical protein CO093_11470 [Alphaproteobacteria bacterium CG_4_9_14_3_um_filter_47_13]|nr:MAG: hypothetical protein CO093_11470 [Alphaproteobacteria bacterium CG_4_9_14_3_um_filter_47_13]
MIGEKEFDKETAKILTETFNALQGKTLTFTNSAGKKRDIKIINVPCFMFAVGYAIAQEDLDIGKACDYLKKKADLAPVSQHNGF